MPLDWEEFDREQRRKAPGREPLGEGERRRVEQLVSQALQVPEAAQARVWGAALGYGRDAEAVIRVNDGIEHGYKGCGHPIAVKLYRCRKPKFTHWHAEQFKRMPGFPGNPRIQQSVTAGTLQDEREKTHSYAVLQYLPGPVLKAWLTTVPGAHRWARSFLGQIFLDMLIPLWRLGHRPWDLRPGNMILDPATKQLTMIDTDSYQNTFAEVTGLTPSCWEKRDEFERGFLRGGAVGIVGRIILEERRITQQYRQKLEKIGSAFQRSGLKEALHDLGRPGSPPDSAEAACQAFAYFLDRLTATGLL